ncbi:hypothetical protein EPUL_004428, partial [Erysiphe pulchra]
MSAEDGTAIISTKGIEAFGRKFTSTAGHLIGESISSTHYQNAMSDLQKQLRRPNIQRSIFSIATSSPTDLVRSRFSSSEIQYRALTYLPDELLKNIPDNESTYSLFQGFQASIPQTSPKEKRSQRKTSRSRQLEEDGSESTALSSIVSLEREKASLSNQLEIMSIRKNMASCEIQEVDNKVSNLMNMRKILLERLASLENEEALLEHDILDVEHRLEDAQELMGDAKTFTQETNSDDELKISENDADNTFLSESTYKKLTPLNITQNRIKKKKSITRKSVPILHERLKPGSKIREFRAHRDAITTMDFDAPFGTLVTAALDDTVRVWDMNTSQCIGLLEGHTASVRVLQVEKSIVATGSVDATIRLWDLQNSIHESYDNRIRKEKNVDEVSPASKASEIGEIEPSAGAIRNHSLFTLEAHMDEVTALHFQGDTLISGSADKTLRQWDLEKGRCVQTLDVMWAAAQTTTSMGSIQGIWRKSGRTAGSDADFVGAVQVFDAALACGTADGMVRLWDLRSGQVHRSLVGHTGPVTCLRFDDVHLVTGSLDRSVRIWDLRTGAIYDAYAYDAPVTSMMFDKKSIVAAAGEDVVKVYDKIEGRHWNCGAGVNTGEDGKMAAIVERVGIIDGYITEGRSDGAV